MVFWCHLGNSVEKNGLILSHLYVIGLKIVLRVDRLIPLSLTVGTFRTVHTSTGYRSPLATIRLDLYFRQIFSFIQNNALQKKAVTHYYLKFTHYSAPELAISYYYSAKKFGIAVLDYLKKSILPILNEYIL